MTTAAAKAELAPTQTDWKRLRSITDEEIARTVAKRSGCSTDPHGRGDEALQAYTRAQQALSQPPPGHEWDEAKNKANTANPALRLPPPVPTWIDPGASRRPCLPCWL